MNKLFAALAAAVGLGMVSQGAAAAPAAPSSPRGIRNNNPLNIRRTSTQWLGEVPGADADYETFGSPEDGIRAGALLLRNYWRLHGLNTVRGIVTRWSPPHENPTSSAIQNVARFAGFGVDERLNMDDQDTIVDLVKAIIRQENGQQPYSDAMIRRNVARAF